MSVKELKNRPELMVESTSKAQARVLLSKLQKDPMSVLSASLKDSDTAFQALELGDVKAGLSDLGQDLEHVAKHWSGSAEVLQQSPAAALLLQS